MSAATDTSMEREARALAMAQHRVARLAERVTTTLEAWAWARANRRRRLIARRAAPLETHLRRDLGLAERVALEVMPAPTPAGGSTLKATSEPLARHELSANDWPVTGANDNVCWRPGRSWLALA